MMEVEIETLAQQFIKLGLSSEVEVWSQTVDQETLIICL